MTDKTKKAFNNAIASVRMEGFDFTDEQIDMLTKLIERVDRDEITWNEAVEMYNELVQQRIDRLHTAIYEAEGDFIAVGGA